MAGLVPAIHDFLSALKISKGVDVRDKPGHDGVLFERSAMRGYCAVRRFIAP
jgi:hypothetical protein